MSANPCVDPVNLRRKKISLIYFLAVLAALLILPVFPASAEEGLRSVTINFSGTSGERQITVDFDDEWLLQPDNIYNHKLMQASFGLAAAGFRDKGLDLFHKDVNILDFFSKLGFSDPETEDYNKITSINTIGTAIAHKKIGDAEVIAISVSGNNYQNEWQSNLVIDDENRPEGFNTAADKVFARLKKYIETNHLTGSLRLWISGYSRAAAVSNITAAEAVDSGLFDAVYGYTIATPRTTKDPDADRYSNIFNVINPFDPVPMVPVPEWGFVRYGTDLFLPSMETDSAYAEKKIRADEYCMKAFGHALHYNPEVNSQLHTILDLTLFFINSSKSYKETYQNGILDIWKNRNPEVLILSILNTLEALPRITSYQMKEFTDTLDYLLQITYTNLRNQILRLKDTYWDPSLSMKENLMHEHFDEAYCCWLLSSDDPDEIFMNDPRYFHYSILGDVEVEVYDADYNFVLRIERDGTISADPADMKIDFFSRSESSPVKLFASRQDEQSLVIFPMDQVFYLIAVSHQDEDIRCAYVEYSAKELRANVRYVLSETVDKDNYFIGNIEPESMETLTDEGLFTLGIHMLEPWSQDIVYSPSAVMRLENTGIFHPTVRFFITMGGLFLLFGLFILILTTIGAGKGVAKGVKAIVRRGKTKTAGSNNSKNDADKEKLSE